MNTTTKLVFSPQAKKALRKARVWFLEDTRRACMPVLLQTNLRPGRNCYSRFTTPRCGTTGCIAGVLGLQSGFHWIDALGLTAVDPLYKAANRCFFAWDFSWPKPLLTRLENARTPKKYTACVVEAIDLLLTNPAVFLPDDS